ncbi:H-NS histone family protein [Wohlfahrtiimonas chitiniclastica]|uniref:H-NS histone family protein n=1 Tax=Wohlfahrtiimonas chitiniclastica TaxID=400946 RepID=A0AB35C027_9GAMM|nr:H-NS histone family protein [Wohlfahrtiimonas chitiniclastica]MBS7824870.1 H-NS histone family protein [Wohlfahrtiimonas chitiniclastica]MBS7840296.1 H-NS histone family protein [Wohlfahrtiimonas chitiniclastica]
MKIDYKKYSLLQLEGILMEVSQEIEERKKLEAESIRQKIENLLQESGLSLDDVYTEKDMGVRSNKVPMKYRHPADPLIQWSGRGKMPIWMRDLIEQGATKDDFLIRD